MCPSPRLTALLTAKFGVDEETGNARMPGDGSWKEWTQQMLAKNDIGYAIKLRQRIVG